MEISEKSVEEIENSDAEAMRKVEAALFISGRYLTLAELVSLTNLNPLILKKILEDLEEKYKDSGIVIIRRDDNWKMDVAREHANIVTSLASGRSEFSNAEQGTLAVIAYKQPIKQSVVIKIRGNKAYDHIKTFVELGLVNKKKTGHTSELTLSENFYDYFHLSNGENILSE